MTTICGVHVPGIGTVIGSNTGATYGDERLFLNETLWLCDGNKAFAMAGEAAAWYAFADHVVQKTEYNILKDGLSNKDILSIFYNVLHGMGTEFKRRKGADFPSFPVGALYATPQGLWLIDSSVTMHRIMDHEMFAIGSGRAYAMGAFYAMDALRYAEGKHDVAEYEENIEMCVRASIKYDIATTGITWTKVLSDDK